MTPDEAKTVAEVYRKLFDADISQLEWDEMDNQMTYLDYLDDREIFNECSVLLERQSKGIISCHSEFCNQGCYAQNVADAVGHILDLYKETQNLHKKNRYVLEQYLSLSHIEFIISRPR